MAHPLDEAARRRGYRDTLHEAQERSQEQQRLLREGKPTLRASLGELLKGKPMAAKKKPAPKAAPPKPENPITKITKNWKTVDEELDFELTFDDEGDPQVTVLDASNRDCAEAHLASGLGGLDEVIAILQDISKNAERIMGGKILPEDTVVDDKDEDNEDDEDEDDEDDDDEENEEDEDE